MGREAALELLKRGWPLGEEPKYDINHALVLCRMHAFSPGLLFLYEHMRLFREVLQASQLHLGTIHACLWAALECGSLLLMCPCQHALTLCHVHN